MKELLFFVLDKMMSVIPGKLLRLIYSPEKVASQIKIKMRSENPFSITIGSSVPNIDLYFEVVNLSNFDLQLDRLLIDLWFGQPTLIGAILRPTVIPAKSADKILRWQSFLSTQQIQQIEPYLSESPPGGNIELSIIAYFESKIGDIELSERYSRRKI